MTFATAILLVGLSLPHSPQEIVAAGETVAAQQTPQPSSVDTPGNAPQDAQEAAPAGEQRPPDSSGDDDAKKPPTPPHTGVHALLDGLLEDVQHLPAKPNAYLAVIGGGMAVWAHQGDTTFNVRLRSHYDAVNTAFAPGKYLGGTAIQVGGAVATYAYGRLAKADKVSHLGMDLLRAQILTEGLVETIKVSTRRERPDHSNRQSFPSGHAAVTFATATVIERHLGWKQSVLAYGIASYVAASRLHDNVHYLSDVVFGAAVGAIGGRTVTQHGRNTWTFVPAPVPGGMAVYAVRAGRDD